MAGDNYGIRVEGHGQFHADVVAVGDRAKAVSTLRGRGEVELAEQLSALVDALNDHVRELPEQVAVREAAPALVAELTSEQPRTPKVRELLEQLAAAANSVGAVLTPVNSLLTAVKAM